MNKPLLISVLLIFCVAHLAQAHSRLKATGPIAIRSTSAGIKTGPCGGLPKSTTPPMHIVGSTMQVQWEETIQHPGRYEFYFSPANDTGFVLLSTVIDVQDSMADLPHQFSTTLTLPNTLCTNCTIQMIQVMTEIPATPSLYFSCADINLVPVGTVIPPPPPTPPLPPGSAPVCH